jgi:hypothetical protein
MPSDAFSLITQMLARAYGDQPSFPPTELFSEGWMLRLLLEAASSGHATLPFSFLDGASWYSEAQLSSAFRPRTRRDPHGEGHTHADGVVGHFAFRDDTTAGLSLRAQATQFVVIEAKMSSRLAPDTSKVSWFDQAARNVAAMAWAIHTSNVDVGQFKSLGFYVFAPRYRLVEDATFRKYTATESIRAKIARRIALYIDDAEATARLHPFSETTLPLVLSRLDLRTVAWEETLAQVSPTLRTSLEDFYRACLYHNRQRGSG